MKKVLGKIDEVFVGYGGYQGAMVGIIFWLKAEGMVGDFGEPGA